MPELSFQSQLFWEIITICYFFITGFQMKTFMAQCPTILPLCHVISSFVLEWINLYIIRWEVVSAWWEKSALGNALEMGMVLVPSEERKGEQWNSMFYYLLCDTHWLLSPSQGSGTKFSSGAPGIFGDYMSIQAVDLLNLKNWRSLVL